MSNPGKLRFQYSQSIRRTTIKRGQQTMFSITLVTVLAAGVLLGLQLFGPNEQSKAEIKILPPGEAGTYTGGVTFIDGPDGAQAKFMVGIVSGHRGYDPGAVCPDGLTEADVNYTIAQEVVNLLKRRNVQADLLDEYDDRLTEYQADALVSIHSDSCNIPGASGFKVARVTDSAIPEAEDLLVACLEQEYATYTGMPQHPASITDSMTDYHAFNEIAPRTPGAIIETGFMLESANWHRRVRPSATLQRAPEPMAGTPP